MSEPLPLYPGASRCVGSGFCCKQAPCPFGRWNAQHSGCEHLAPLPTTTATVRYTCAIAREIMLQAGWEQAPAFGAGCCSPLFNEQRTLILEEEWRERKST